MSHGENRKEVIGGYILFPGRGSVDSIRAAEYYKSIERVNIGAYPLLPTTNKSESRQSDQLLKDYLHKILIERPTIEHIQTAIPQRGLQYREDVANPTYVLVGYIKDKDVKAFEKHHIYYIRAYKEGKKEIEVVPNYEKAEYVLLHGTKGAERQLYKVEKGAHFLSAKSLKELPDIPYQPDAEDSDVYIGYKVEPEPITINGFDINKVELGTKQKRYEPKVIAIEKEMFTGLQ